MRRREAGGRASVLLTHVSDRQEPALNAASRGQALPGPPRKDRQSARRNPLDPDAPGTIALHNFIPPVAS